MVQRITDEVNATLAQEEGQHQLSEQAVLDLIDQGASQGGPEVCCRPPVLLSPCQCSQAAPEYRISAHGILLATCQC